MIGYSPAGIVLFILIVYGPLLGALGWLISMAVRRRFSVRELLGLVGYSGVVAWWMHLLFR